MTEALRWRITKAVRASGLPAPARLIMLVLADVAEVGTAEIPERFTPSIAVLAEETGLDRSTVKRHLAALEAAGWIDRTVPDARAQGRCERTRYRLTLPPGAESTPVPGRTPHRGAENARDPGAESTHPGAQEATPLAQTAPPDTDLVSDPGQIKNPSTDLAVVERPDVEQVCRHLADRIEENGSKRPTVTKAWREAARRLIDRDGRTVEQILRAIDWCQADDFWRANILSMPKLREQYDRLRLAAQRSRASPKPSTTDVRVAAAMALAQKFAEQEAS